MPRYFFHVDDHPSSPDAEGTVLPDAQTARSEALRYAAGLLAHASPSVVMHTTPFRVRVTDETGAEVVLLEIHDKAVAQGKPTAE